MKYLATIITILRLFLTFILLFVEALTPIFFLLYVSCGITDMLDGYIARKTNTASTTGAILDSIADGFFLFATAFKVLPVVHLPTWILWWALIIAAIRLISYLIGYIRFKQFISLHTYLNKCTGLLLFLSPLFYPILDSTILGGSLVLIAVLSACEECFITSTSKIVDRDRRSLFTR